MGRTADGVVTFLFTDIEGSTRRWEADPAGMRGALADHDEVLRRAVEAQGGWLFKHTGDGICAAFGSPGGALHAAAEAQRQLSLPVRMGIATGEAERRGEDYFGPGLNRAARVMDCGHGGQVLVAGSTAGLVSGFELVDLGEHRLRDLAEPVAVWQLGVDGLPTEFPPLRTLDSVSGNLPIPSTGLVGREDAVVSIEAAVESARVVTLAGVGGVGKTRLALEVANATARQFPDGAWLVELAPVLDAAEVAESVAAIFTVPPPADGHWMEAVVATLAGRRLLLVLDNCEHVLDGAAELVAGLVARAADVRVLATSREGLGVEGEVVWSVPSLETGPDSAASALFVERAASAAPDVDIGDQLDEVAEICGRLDGIPLAIELAAARVRSMSPAQIRGHLDERFRLLIGARRSAERHQTLRHAVQWSFDLLSEPEALFLETASVFAGGFDLEAAMAVCGAEGDLDELATLELVDSLVRKSLLEVDRSGPGLRYELLETIRQFAEERLVERELAAVARDRHARHFADRAEAAFGAFRGPREAEAYEFVDRQIANLRAGFEWAAEAEDPDAAIRIAACTHEIARFRLRTETFGWPGRVVGRARDRAHRLLPLLLTMACDSAWSRGLLDEARSLGREAVAVVDDPRFEPFVWAYTDLAQIAFFEGDPEAGLALLREGADHPADDHDRFVLALLLVWSVMAGRSLPDDELEAAGAQVEARGFPTAVACAVGARARMAVDRDPALADLLSARALDLLRSCGNRLLEQSFWADLAQQAAAGGDRWRALSAFERIVEAWRVHGDTMLARGMIGLADLLADLGERDSATRLLGAVDRTVALASSEVAGGRLRAEMGEAAFTEALEAGASMDHHASADLARAAIDRARSMLDPGST